MLTAAILLSALVTAEADMPPALLIRNATIIDGTGAPPAGPLDIEIVAGRIARIGPGLEHPGAEVIDATAKTVVPGLIDCHTHLPTVPGARLRGDDDASLRAQREAQLRAYLAAGVTTVLDAATPLAFFDEVEAIRQRTVIPRVLGLAPFITPAGGYFAADSIRGPTYAGLTPPIANVGDVSGHIRDAIRHHPLGLKATLEPGFGPVQSLEVFDADARKAIRDAASQAGVRVFVHAESEKAFLMALDYRPYAFMHGGFFSDPPQTETLVRVRESGAYVVSTIAIFSMTSLMWDDAARADAWLNRLVPPNQLATANDADATREVVKGIANENRPWFVPSFLTRLFASAFFNAESVHRDDANAKRTVRAFYDASVPLVMGSDSGNYPLFTTFFHGVGSILEMEALLDAGIPPLEVIRAATSRAATMLALDGEVGTVAPGRVADLVILDRSPLETPTAFRDVHVVVKDGRANTPAAWLAGVEPQRSSQ